MRWITRELGLARQTVKKAVQDSSPPKYNLSRAKPRLVISPIIGIVEQWLKEDQDRPKKQHHTGYRIYERLVKEYDYREVSPVYAGY